MFQQTQVPVLYSYVNTQPGHYPNEGLQEKAYWKWRAYELETQEEEEYARQCSYEEEQALNEYYSLGLMDGRQEWYDQQHLA